MKLPRLLTVLCAGLLAASAMMLAAPAQADDLDHILSTKTLRVAVPQDFPPFGSAGPDLRPVGYDIDMAKYLARKLGVVLEIVPVTSANRIPYLTTNKVDLVISSLGKSPERAQVIDFSDAYAPFYNGVFGVPGEKVKQASDLAGKTVGVTRGAIEDIQLSKIAPASTVIKRYEDNNGTISAFLSGQVDLIASGNVVAAAILAKNPPKKPEPKFLMQNSPCYVGLNKGQPRLLARVNELIAQGRRDGSLDTISMQWLGAKLPANF